MSAADIALTVGGVTLANVLFFAPATGKGALGDINWRILPATGIFALMMAGLSKLSPQAANGIAVTALFTVLFTRVGNAPAPLENISSRLGFGGTKT
jgi:hypothetical protein